MAYKNRTVEDVYGLIVRSFQEKFNDELKMLPKSFVAVTAKVLAGVFVVCYKMCGWFYLQMFPDTASFERVNVLGRSMRPLVELGKLFGVGEPKSGQEWRGTMTVRAVTQGKTLALGTQLKSELTGFIYNVAANTQVDADCVEVSVYCTQAGEAGNLADGDRLKLVSPLGFVESEGIVSGTSQKGCDDETEEHYRSRVKTGYGPQPQGGSLTDYRTWALDAAGVEQVYPYTDRSSPGGVLIYVAGSPGIYADRLADRELCVAVGEVCTYDPNTGSASRLPLGAVLDPAGDGTYTNVQSVEVSAFDVYVNGVSGAGEEDFAPSLKSELGIFFAEREPFIRGLDDENARSDTITRNAVIAVIHGVAVSMKAGFVTAEMRRNGAETDSYRLGQGELCKLGNLYIDGVLYEG